MEKSLGPTAGQQTSIWHQPIKTQNGVHLSTSGWLFVRKPIKTRCTNVRSQSLKFVTIYIWRYRESLNLPCYKSHGVSWINQCLKFAGCLFMMNTCPASTCCMLWLLSICWAHCGENAKLTVSYILSSLCATCCSYHELHAELTMSFILHSPWPACDAHCEPCGALIMSYMLL